MSREDRTVVSRLGLGLGLGSGLGLGVGFHLRLKETVREHHLPRILYSRSTINA